MRITKRRLKQIIREESSKLNESARRDAQYRAMMDPSYEVPVGMEWDEPYDDEYDNPDHYARATRYKRKTTYAGRDILEPMIKAVQAALAAKPNSFLQSVLSQMEAGRMPSAKQKAIVKRIIKKHNPASAQLFESAGAMPLIGIGTLGSGPMSARPKGQSLNEAAYLHDILEDAAIALNRRDVEALERLLSEFDGMLIGSDEARGYKMALQAMIDAAYMIKDAYDIGMR